MFLEILMIINLCSIAYLFYYMYSKSREDDSESFSDIDIEEGRQDYIYQSYYEQ